MKVYIYSRERAELAKAEGFPRGVAVISFCDPVSRRARVESPVDYRGHCDRVIYAAVHDVDIEVLPEVGLDFDSYFPEAASVAEFIYRAKEEGRDIICQCEYGQSRSAACAAAILEHFERDGISVFRDYRYYPNQLIFNKLTAALDEYGQG